MAISLKEFSENPNASGAVRILVIVWSAVGTLMLPPIMLAANSALSVLTSMHENIDTINLRIAGYEELRKQRDQAIIRLGSKDEEHDRFLLDHEKRLSRLEGELFVRKSPRS